MNHCSRSFRTAFCSILGTAMTVLMMLGTLFPLATYLCPMVSGFLLIPAVWEYGSKTCALLYLTVSLLSLFLVPDKEAAVLFLFLFGWYPVLRPRIQRIKKRFLRIFAKAILFNGAVCIAYAVLLFVFVSPDLWIETKQITVPFIAALLLSGNITFFIYDRCLLRATDFYVFRLRKKLFHYSH